MQIKISLCENLKSTSKVNSYSDLLDIDFGVDGYLERQAASNAARPFLRNFKDVVVAGFGTSEADEGLYFSRKDGTYVYLMSKQYAPETARTLRITKPFFVWLDTNDKEGPFIREPDPVAGTLGQFSDIKKALEHMYNL